MKRLLILLLVIVGGCIIDEPETNIGNSGIDAKFVEDRIQIYHDNELEISTKYTNLGAYDQPFGKVVLYGYDKSVIAFAEDKGGYAEKKLPKLNAKNTFTPQGGYDTMSFNSKTITLREGEKYETNLMLAACYHYKTILTQDICVASSQNRDDCSSAPISLSGQGAPLGITDVSYDTISNKLEIVATVKNLEGGTLVSPGDSAYDSCPFNLEDKEKDLVKVDMSVTEFEKESCSEEVLTLYNGEGKVRCTFSPYSENMGSYTAQLKIELDYNYLTKDRMELTIFGSP